LIFSFLAARFARTLDFSLPDEAKTAGHRQAGQGEGKQNFPEHWYSLEAQVGRL
jgi:hypothetical protein